MIRSAQILDLELDRAFYQPGEAVRLTLHLRSEVDTPAAARLAAAVYHLAGPVDAIQRDVALDNGAQRIDLTWRPPPAAPRGYGIDVRLESKAGDVLARAATAFDVLEHWTQMPRYGFLTDFAPGRSDAMETMTALTRYHINALQFYDWMYRHEQFLTDRDPYRDPLGRTLSRQTVDALIGAAHAHGIAAMPYTAVYGASVAFYREHPNWALLKPDGQPVLFGEDFLVIMDPRPDSPWSHHLLSQFDRVLEQTAFDGIHLDQYGDPKVGYDAAGRSFDLDAPLAAFIDATRARVNARRANGAVVFNAVNNWPIDAVAPAGQNIVYIEVWPPHNWLSDLHALIVQAQALGHGKPVVLAAYISPGWEHTARLIDAVIFASGGGHIELGERDGMLADAYFPNYATMTPALASAMRRYYDFAVRYQEVIGPRTRDATRPYLHRVSIDGVSTSPALLSDKVWPIVREGEGFTAISLVNLVGVNSPEWAQPIASPPQALGPATVRITADRQIDRIWRATPDGDDPSPQSIAFTRRQDLDGNPIVLEMPFLKYWSVLVLEWTE